MVKLDEFRDCGLGHSSVRYSLLSSGSRLKSMAWFKLTSEDIRLWWILIQWEATPKELNLLEPINMETNTTKTSIPCVPQHLDRSQPKKMGLIQRLFVSKKSERRHDSSQMARMAYPPVRRSPHSWKHFILRPLLWKTPRMELLLHSLQAVYFSNVKCQRESPRLRSISKQSLCPRMVSHN